MYVQTEDVKNISICDSLVPRERGGGGLVIKSLYYTRKFSLTHNFGGAVFCHLSSLPGMRPTKTTPPVKSFPCPVLPVSTKPKETNPSSPFQDTEDPESNVHISNSTRFLHKEKTVGTLYVERKKTKVNK